MSVLATLALGGVGAIIGGLIGHLFNRNTGIFELNVVGFIIAVIAVIAVIAAVLLIGVAEGVSGGRSRGAVRCPLPRGAHRPQGPASRGGRHSSTDSPGASRL